MKKKGRVTMYDVALAANVTPQTVSRAFRNTPDISEETRQRILKIAADLNYVMNNTASSLRGGNSRLIVVVYDNLMNVYFSVMVDYLQNSLREKGYSILMLSVPQARFDRSTYEFAVSHSAAGVVSFLEPEEEIEGLVDQFGIPVLIFGRRSRLRNVDYIRTDDEEGGRLAAKRLAEDGVRRFAYLTVDFSVSCAAERFRGFSEEIARLGLEAPVVVNDFVSPLEESLIRLFSNEETAPEGFFCFNDMIAFDLLFLLEKHGFPRVRVVGYDCIQQELHFPVRLTSVGTDKFALASRASSMIVSAIESKERGGRGETLGVFLLDGTTA
ncbi:MAG: LacI family DNA-binding transcriptional regulator [Candidatus Gallimonas sp.]